MKQLAIDALRYRYEAQKKSAKYILTKAIKTSNLTIVVSKTIKKEIRNNLIYEI